VSDGKTIFEGLYQIDWSQSAVYDPLAPYRIPHALRDLLSDDVLVREDAQIFLFEHIVETEDDSKLDPIADHIVYIVLEILELAETPDKDRLVSGLSRIAWVCEGDKSRVARITDDLIVSHIPYLLTMLNDPSGDLRIAIAHFLSEFSEQAQIIIPYFMQRLEDESDLEVQIALLRGVEAVFSNLKKKQLPDFIEMRDRFLPVFWNIAHRYTSQTMRGISAQVGMSLILDKSNTTYEYKSIPSHIALALIESFFLAKKNSGYWIPWHEKETILNYLNLFHNSQEIFATLLQDKRAEYSDAQLVEKAVNPALMWRKSQKKPPLLNRIINTLKSLLPD
jgi:hypothetical protein